MPSDYLQIVVSLPQKNGILIKNTLKKIAKDNKRSLANQCLTILTEWLEANGYIINAEPQDETPEAVTLASLPVPTPSHDADPLSQGREAGATEPDPFQ